MREGYLPFTSPQGYVQNVLETKEVNRLPAQKPSLKTTRGGGGRGNYSGEMAMATKKKRITKATGPLGTQQKRRKNFDKSALIRLKTKLHHGGGSCMHHLTREVGPFTGSAQAAAAVRLRSCLRALPHTTRSEPTY